MREIKLVGVGALFALCSALPFLVLDLFFSPVAVHAAALVNLSLKNAALVHDKQKPNVDKLTANGSLSASRVLPALEPASGAA